MRRLYAECAGDEEPSSQRCRSGDPDDQLWDFDCLYEGNFETEHGGTGAGQIGNLGGKMNGKSVNN